MKKRERTGWGMVMAAVFWLSFFITAMILIGIARCARAADPWDTTDTVLFGSFVVLEGIDIAQTAKIKRVKICDSPTRYDVRPYCYRKYDESNPEFGVDPNMTRVVGYKLLDIAVIGGLGYVLPSGMRKALFIGADVVQFTIDHHNYTLGLKWGF